MLILSRYVGESIIINGGTPDEIIITVVSKRYNNVSIGINAPKHIIVHREEIQEKIREEKND